MIDPHTEVPIHLDRLMYTARAGLRTRLLRFLQHRYPHIYGIHMKLAGDLWNAGRCDQALTEWRLLVEQFPYEPNPYFMRAMWALDKRHWRHAEEFLRQCLRRDDGYFYETAHFWRAECLYRSGCHFSAQEALEHVSEDYCELYFLGYRKRSKQDLIRDISDKVQSRTDAYALK